MRVAVPWGTGTVPVEIEEGRVGGVLGADVEQAADPTGVLRAALTAPGVEWDAFVAAAPSPLLVVVNDGTRPTPTADVLAQLRRGLERWLGEGDHQLSFVIATGTHRAASPEEIDRIFGRELAEAHAERISSHDSGAKDGLVRLGTTTRGTEILANRLLAEARGVVLINSVEPHYYAGYTGGRKSLFPGLAGYETVWANHKLSMETGSDYLALQGNPVHEDLQESLDLGIAGKQVYSIQLVLDKGHRIGFASAGPLDKTFSDAQVVAERQFVLELDRRYEVVVAVAPHPMDCDLYQSNKAIQSGSLAVEDGGVLILVSQCTHGLGENQTLYDMLAAVDSPAEALERAGRQEYRLGGHQATRVAEILRRADIWVVSSLDDEIAKAMFMTPFGDVQGAVDTALVRRGEKARVLFLTEASITVPRVRGEG